MVCKSVYGKCQVMLIVVSVLTGYGCKKQEGQVKPNKQYKIAFVSGRDGNDEIYVMNSDGSGQRRLTNNPATDEDPQWSPDGTRIAFRSYRLAVEPEIYVMNADGSEQKNLTNNPASDTDARWSPDGTRIAFRSDRLAVEPEICVMNADGSERKILTNKFALALGPHFASLRWSPDGKKMAFTSWRRSIRIPFLSDGNNKAEIHVMNPDGSEKKRLTDTGMDWGPVWSPVPLPTKGK